LPHEHFSLSILSFANRYIIPLAIATISYILRAVADLTCSSYSQTCRNTSELLSHIYAVVIIFLLIVGGTKAQQLKEFFGRVKSAIELIANGGDKAKRD
jgi:atlastin